MTDMMLTGRASIVVLHQRVVAVAMPGSVMDLLRGLSWVLQEASSRGPRIWDIASDKGFVAIRVVEEAEGAITVHFLRHL